MTSKLRNDSTGHDRRASVQTETVANRRTAVVMRDSVYFIQAGGQRCPVKIGRAKDVKMRLADLQVANHETLTLLMAVECNSAMNLEAELHFELKDARLRGEWYAWGRELDQAMSCLRHNAWGAGRRSPNQDTAAFARYTKAMDLRLIYDLQADLVSGVRRPIPGASTEPAK